MAGQRTSVYLGDGLAAAVKASGVPLAELVRCGLAARSGTPVPVPADTQATKSDTPVADSRTGIRLETDGSPAAPAVLSDGEPSPGVLCAGPGCFQRDTARYGLRRLVLCPACRAALEGQEYRRPVPPGAARVIRGTAA